MKAINNIINNISLRTMNIFLVIILISVVCILSVRVIFQGDVGRSVENEFNLVSTGSIMGGVTALKDISYYRNAVSSRELFKPLVFKKAKQAQEKTIQDLTKDIILVGVVSVGQKEAIVKNRRTRQTYFVTPGSNVGELKVLEISDDKIKVGYRQEQQELFLR